MVLALAFLATASFSPRLQSDDIVFSRSYKVHDTSRYDLSVELPGNLGASKCEIETTVIEVAKDYSTVRFRALHLDLGPLPNNAPLPDITTKVGPTGMPNAASIQSGEEFFIFLSVLAMTPNKTVHVGDSVQVAWTSDKKDVSFSGSGKILSLDKDKKTLTVHWDLTMAPSYTQSAEFKATTTYSLPDCALASSEGSIGGGDSMLKLKASRQVSKP